MAQSQFSLSWDEYKTNICLGLCTLQQNGEFVDMTLAADGHMVKVHQIILALASPYIKELISSANCPHPVIFLNKISYGTLCSILEYIYTGEVLVAVDNINELVEAGKELHIKGLEDMMLPGCYDSPSKVFKNDTMVNIEDEISYFEVPYQNDDERMSKKSMEVTEEKSYITSVDENSCDLQVDPERTPSKASKRKRNKLSKADVDQQDSSVMQYTVSNQGSLQLIVNRYVYYLKHSNKNRMTNWRCVDYLNNAKCPAQVITKEDMIIHRYSAHNHAFHDKRILKKINTGAVFTSIQDAEVEGYNVREKYVQDRRRNEERNEDE